MTLHAPAAVAVPVRKLARLGDAVDDPIPQAGKTPFNRKRPGARCKTSWVKMYIVTWCLIRFAKEAADYGIWKKKENPSNYPYLPFPVSFTRQVSGRINFNYSSREKKRKKARMGRWVNISETATRLYAAPSPGRGTSSSPGCSPRPASRRDWGALSSLQL